MDRYLSTLYEIVTRGRNTNSYKFALWRALVTLAPKTNAGNPVISKSDLAPLFLGYYWPLEVKYHLRQGIDPDKDPVVMVMIRQLVTGGKIQPGEAPRSFQKRWPEEYQALLDRVTRQAFDYVIPCFHTVHGAPITPAIFTFTGTEGKAGDTIELTKGGRQFLIDNGKIVDSVAVSGWVRFTEAFTSAPRLHDKISGISVTRGSVSKWRKSLLAMQYGKCFYNESHDMASPEVDHVLPWSFVLENRTWNLVLACRDCNNGKRDRLVSMADIERLCVRNQQVAKGEIPADATFLRHFTEWHSRDLSSHIRGLCDQAVADGFPVWK